MYQFNTIYSAPVSHPVIVLSAGNNTDKSLRKPLHSGVNALEGLVITFGGEVHFDKPVTIKQYKEDKTITALGMTEAGLLALAADNPDKEFLLWGITAEGADALQTAILNSRPDIPDDNILERDYLRALNKQFICEHGELDEGDLLKISKARNIMALSRMSKKPVPMPGDSVEGTYYSGKFPFRYGIIDSRNYMLEDGMLTFCAAGSPYIIPDSGDLSISGGPFFRVEPKHLTFAGQEERLFWTFGHDGACAHGGIHFPVLVNRWTLSPDADI